MKTLGVILALLIGTSSLRAADNVWTNSSGNFTWSNFSGNNWSLGQWQNGNTDAAIFGSTGVGTINVSGQIFLRAMQFNANGYTINGDPLILTDGGFGSGLAFGEFRIDDANHTATIGSSIRAVTFGTAKLIKTGAGRLTLTGTNLYNGGTDINAGGLLVGNGTNVGTLGSGTATIAAGADLAYWRNDNPTLSNSYAGAGQIVFYGSPNAGEGSFTLTANSSSFSGVISLDNSATFNPSRLYVTNPNQIGSAQVVVNNTSGLFLDSGTYTNALNIRGDGWNEAFSLGRLGALRLAGGATVSGPVTLSGNSRLTTFQSFDTGTISGAISGAFAVEKTGAGTLTLSGANTFTGGLTANAGTLNLTGSNIYGTGNVFVNTATLNIPGGGSVSTAFGLIGSNTGSTGTVNVGGGTGPATWTNSGSLFVGDFGTGTLTITGGGSVSNTDGYIGFNPGSTGTVNVGGGTGSATWTNSGSIEVGFSSSFSTSISTLNITTGGTVTAAALDGGNLNSSVNFNGGMLRITGTDSASNTINLQTNGGTIGVTNAANTFDISSAISGAGRLTKIEPGTLTLSGANTFTGGLTVDTGTLNLTGSNSYGTGNLSVNTASLNITGSVSNSFGYIGFNAATSGAATVGGTATWSSALLGVGLSGTGTLSIRDNSSVTSTLGTIGFNPGSSGTVTVGGSGNATWTNSGVLEVGRSGTGTLNITTGGTVTAASLDGSGSVNFNGGTLRITGTDSASNTINLQTNGGTIGVPNAANTFTITSAIAGAGGLTKTEPGTLTLSGANTFTGGLTANAGTLNLTGSNNYGTGSVIVNTATLSIPGGGSVSNRSGFIGFASGSTGTVNVGGGTGSATWTNSGSLFVGDSGTGTLTITTGGTVTAAALEGSGSINFNGGTLRITGTDSVFNTINLQTNGGTVGVPNAANTFTIGSTISGAGGLTKTEPGTLTLSGANTFTGGATINGGTLQVTNTTGSGTGTGAVTVASGGTLGGTGIISGATTVGNTGIIRGGNATGDGTLTLGSSLTIGSGGTLSTKIASTSATANLVAATGAFTFNSAGKVLIDGNNVAFNPATSYTYTIASSGTSTAGLNVTDQSVFSFANFTNSGDFTFSLTGNAGGAVFLNFAPVPEPGAILAVCGLAVGGVAAWRRRK